MYQLIIDGNERPITSEYTTLEQALTWVDIALSAGANSIALWYNNENLIEFWIKEK